MMMWYGGTAGIGMMMFLMVIFYVVILIMAWKFVKAHESLAESLKIIAQHLKKEP
ncbi:hypothetical protein [Desulfovirgula thermocuniculi]|uniref:hypothetical protein n=1 Tax=Desulfovirgula thermocuniculi TaxID=348842 RepID=UPI0003FDF1C5|nr:hypothetical protein [Desulfovirgula thermocuniculi]